MGARKGSEIPTDGINRLRDMLDTLRADFEKHKGETVRNLQNLNLVMPTKADKMELMDLERRFKEIIDDIVKQMLELMPNKEDIQAKMQSLNRKLKEMHDSMRTTIQNEDDAMLSKKHLGPLNCASCDKGIINLN